jgi:hypothetical protein
MSLLKVRRFAPQFLMSKPKFRNPCTVRSPNKRHGTFRTARHSRSTVLRSSPCDRRGFEKHPQPRQHLAHRGLSYSYPLRGTRADRMIDQEYRLLALQASPLGTQQVLVFRRRSASRQERSFHNRPLRERKRCWPLIDTSVAIAQTVGSRNQLIRPLRKNPPSVNRRPHLSLF